LDSFHEPSPNIYKVALVEIHLIPQTNNPSGRFVTHSLNQERNYANNPACFRQSADMGIGKAQNLPRAQNLGVINFEEFA